MTGKLYCPFCHRALARYGVQCKEYGVCRDENCPSERNFLPIEIWQALIDGKKAQDALKVATDCIESIGGTWRDGPTWTNDDMGEIRVNIEGYCDSILKKIKEIKK